MVVAVQDPRRGAGLGDAVLELILHPLHRARQLRLLRRAVLGGVLVIGLGRDGAQGPAQAVVADDLAHAQDARGHAVAAQCAHVRVAAMPIQGRQHPGAQHIDKRGRVGAGVAQRATLEPGLEQAACLQVLGEERQLTQRRGAAAQVRVEFFVMRR